MDAGTNEQRSAELFERLAQGADPAFRRRVCGLIMATRHVGRERSPDRRFIVDIDLAGFGAPWDEFMRNGALLREESPARPTLNTTATDVVPAAFQRQRHFRDRLFSRPLSRGARDLCRLLDDLANRYAPSTR
jgi:predicted metal-dependent HD superfamily phosphohydrolase